MTIELTVNELKVLRECVRYDPSGKIVEALVKKINAAAAQRS